MLLLRFNNECFCAVCFSFSSDIFSTYEPTEISICDQLCFHSLVLFLYAQIISNCVLARLQIPSISWRNPCSLSELPAGSTADIGLIVGVVIGWTMAVTASAALLFVVWRTRKANGKSNESAEYQVV